MTDPETHTTSEDELEAQESSSQFEFFPQLVARALRRPRRDAFKIRQDRFRSAVGPVKLGQSDFVGAGRTPRTAKFDIQRNDLRISIRRDSMEVHSHALIHLARAAAEVAANRLFDFPLHQLRGLSHPKLRGTSEWLLNPANARVKILLDGAELNLSTFPPATGLNPGELLERHDLGEFGDPSALMRGLEFASLFARKDKNREFEIIELSDGFLRAGQPEGVVFMQDPRFARTNLRLTVSDARKLRSVLRCLKSREARFFEDGEHYRISGHSAAGAVICIIDKPEHSFPSFDPLMERALTCRLQVPTVRLLECLDWVHSAIERKDESVQVKYDSSQITFRVDHWIGPSERTFDVSPAQPAAAACASWSLNVQFKLLLNIAKGISSCQFVELGVVEGQRMLRLHWEDDPVRGWAFLFSQAKTDRRGF